MRMRKAKLAHSMNMRMTLANKTPDQLRTSAALLQLQSEFRKPAAFLYSQDACMCMLSESYENHTRAHTHARTQHTNTDADTHNAQASTQTQTQTQTQTR